MAYPHLSTRAWLATCLRPRSLAHFRTGSGKCGTHCPGTSTELGYGSTYPRLSTRDPPRGAS
eukprot:642507-Rhodomonas_salina.2